MAAPTPLGDADCWKGLGRFPDGTQDHQAREYTQAHANATGRTLYLFRWGGSLYVSDLTPWPEGVKDFHTVRPIK